MVKVAGIDIDKVGSDDNRKEHTQHCPTLYHLAVGIACNRHGRQQNKQQRTPRIATHRCGTLLSHSRGCAPRQLLVQTLLDILLSTLLLQHLTELLGEHLATLLHTEVTQLATADNHHRQDTYADTCSPRKSTAQTLRVDIFFNNLSYAHRSQQGNGPLHHNQSGREGTELIISGQVVEQQLGKPHHMVAPRHKERQHARTDNPPSLTVGQKHKRQHRQEDCRST